VILAVPLSRYSQPKSQDAPFEEGQETQPAVEHRPLPFLHLFLWDPGEAGHVHDPTEEKV